MIERKMEKMDKKLWVYLAAPYSDPDPKVVEKRMEIYSRVDAKLILEGYYTMSPLSKHWLLQYQPLPSDWNFWQGYGTEMLTKCDIMYIICMQGWQESVGVQAELELALKLNKPVVLLDENGEKINKE
jgi:hypothetical protein